MGIMRNANLEHFRDLLRTVLVVLGVLIWTVCLYRAYSLIQKTGEQVAPTHKLQVDGKHYLDRAHEMIESGSYLVTPDTYHSMPMQILLAGGLRLTGSLAGAKMFQLFALVAMVWLSYVLFCRVLGTSLVGPSAWCLLGLSQSLVYYAAMTQYELLLMVVLTGFSLLVLRRPTRFVNLMTGFTLWCSGIFRPHYLLLPVWLVFSPGERRQRELALATFVLLSGLWNGFYIWQTHRPFVFMDLQKGYNVERALSATSTGRSYPKSPLTSSGGLRFIVQHPVLYFQLLQRRASYLSTFSKDTWHVPSVWENLAPHVALSQDSVRRAIAVLGTALALIGALLLSPVYRLAVLSPLVCVLAAQLVVNSSFRFLVPVLPHLICLQIVGLRSILDSVQTLQAAIRRQIDNRVTVG